jgi:hypothetical protein
MASTVPTIYGKALGPTTSIMKLSGMMDVDQR